MSAPTGPELHRTDPVSDPNGSLDRRRRFLSRVALVALAVATGFTGFHLSEGYPERAILSLSAVAVAGILSALLRRPRGLRAALATAAVYAAGITLWLLASPLWPAADFLWCLLVPPLLAWAGGASVARWALPAWVGAVSIVVLHPGFPRLALWQDLELHARFLGLLVMVSALSWLYEQTRNRAQARLEAEVQERRRAEEDIARANARLAEIAAQAQRLTHLAEAASEAKSRFLSQMSHDIRTPLTGILGMTDLLDLTPLDEKQRGYLRVLRVNGEALNELIGDILDLARIEAGRVELRLTTITPRAFLEEVRTVLEPLAARKGIALVTRISPVLPDRLLGDPARLRQILLNLGGNAVKFTEAGEVVLALDHVEGSPHRWAMRVTDTGPGIPENQHSTIFEAFQQGDVPSGRRKTGTGLGLAICARLADLMGGSIQVTSEVGQGSTFSVDLPILAPTGQRQALIERATATPLPGPVRLLVVDDSETVRRVVTGLLRRAGHEVEEAPDGASALAILSRTCFDAVLMDIEMPGIDGLEAMRRIRAGADGVLQPQVPLVAVTALVDPDTRVRSLEAGAAEVVAKPVELTVLLGALAGAVRAGGGPGGR